MGYRDKVRTLPVHGNLRFASEGIYPYTQPRVTMTGTIITGGVMEAAIKAGGETLILTIAQGKWAKSGAVFNAARQAMINGLVSAQAEAGGWNAEIKADEVVGSVVRTSDTVLTWTNTANANYAITANETITVTIPAAIMEGQYVPLVAGTFVVTKD
jgi:hypothetical protein